MLGMQSIAISKSVYLPVHLHIFENTFPNFMKFSLHVNYGRGSGHLWWLCFIYFRFRKWYHVFTKWGYTLCPKKCATILLPLTLPNTDWFSKFHWQS